jgi:type IV secretory pathway TraG/TraD family ATPase VirD4
MNAQTHSILTGGSGLAIGWLLTWIPLFVGLVHGRASWGKFLMSPLVAIGVTFLAGIVNAMLSPLMTVAGMDSGGALAICIGMLVCVATGYAAGRALAQAGKRDSGPQHRRGAVVEDTEMQGRSSFQRPQTRRAEPPEGVLTLAGMPVAFADETKHFKFIGTTGTGKSTAIRELLRGALDRGDRAIIADPDGGYLDRFYDSSRGDVILNPFDGDAHKWDLFAEIENDYDVEQLARSLIPDSGDSERIWSDYARTFFTAVTRQVMKVTQWDESELFRLLTAAPREELRIMLAGTPAGPFLEEGNEKMFGSIRSVTGAAVRGLEHTTRQQAGFLSVRQWVKNGQGSGRSWNRGVLFLPYTAGQIAGLRSLISAWMRLAIFQAMDCAEGDQRLWFVIDEVDALGEIDGLKDALARVRKFGGRCMLGLQSIAQMSGTYGKGAAETIVENCGNTFIFRCSASERGGTSEFASKLIGQREVLHTTRSTSLRGFLTPDSTTLNESIKIEPAVMASEIERLPDLEGFLKLASNPDWRRVRLTPRNEPMVERPHRPLMTTLPPPPLPPRSPDSAASPPAPPSQQTPASAAAPPTSIPPKARGGNGSSARVPAAKRTRRPKNSSKQTSAPMNGSAVAPDPSGGPNGVAPGHSSGAESEHRIS